MEVLNPFSRTRKRARTRMHVHAQVQTSGHDCLKSVTLFRSASLPNHLSVALSLARIMLSVIVVSGHETRLCWCPRRGGGGGVIASKLRLCTHENAHLQLLTHQNGPARTRIGRPPFPLPGKPRSAHRPACAWCLCHMLPGPAGSQAGTRAQARKHARTHARTHSHTQARIRTFTNRVKAGQQRW
jgi:hypothetical protein